MADVSWQPKVSGHKVVRMVNKIPALCKVCGETVQPGAGVSVKAPARPWVTVHVDCEGA